MSHVLPAYRLGSGGRTLANYLDVCGDLRYQSFETVIDALSPHHRVEVEAQRPVVDVGAVVVEEVRLDAQIIDIAEVRVAPDADCSGEALLPGIDRRPAGIDALCR